MQEPNTAMKLSNRATGGRAASRERRAQLVQGKTALPPAAERSRTGQRSAATLGAVNTAAPTAAPQNQAKPASAPAQASSATSMPATNSATTSRALTGREASLARRAGLVQGKGGLQHFQQSVATSEAATTSTVPTTPSSDTATGKMLGSGRMAAQALRNARAKNGRGDSAPTRPSGRLRQPQPINYAPKVAQGKTYSGQQVTGVRIGSSGNVTGDEPGAMLQVTGSQYIGTEHGFNPREFGIKVGAARTGGGQVVTGTQVRSKIKITGDESNSSIRITGESDQEIADDLLNRREQGVYASMQFQRQNNPHGHTVFGTNLGRSIKSIGSRERNTERAIEQTDGGLAISGTAVGRSVRVTGDEAGSCHSITGDQYLMPAQRQALCESDAKQKLKLADAGRTMGGLRQDPVTGEKVTVSESWRRLRITGVDVEHNENVTGDEYGVCSPITGTPYVGPGQYEAYCAVEDSQDVTQRATPGLSAGQRVTGDTPLNVAHVTGTQRGGERELTGTPYYRHDLEDAMGQDRERLNQINQRFTVHTPQREAQLRSDAAAVEAASAETRITGSFSVGAGKITGNQEFHFMPRGGSADAQSDKVRITGEGKYQGTAITGDAWRANENVTGTEGYIATERNPSERAGKPHGFANSRVFKGKGKHEPARQIVTGMVGWSAKSAAKVTMSGGAQG